MKDTGMKDLAEALLEDSALANRIFPIVLGELPLLVVHCWQSEEECTQRRPSEDSRELHMGTPLYYFIVKILNFNTRRKNSIMTTLHQ